MQCQIVNALGIPYLLGTWGHGEGRRLIKVVWKKKKKKKKGKKKEKIDLRHLVNTGPEH